MAAIDTHTTTPAPPPTQGEDAGGRNWALIWAIVGLVAFFAALGIYIAMNQGDTPTATPTPTTSVSDEQAAYDASTKTVTDMRSWIAANPGQEIPAQYATAAFIEETRQATAKVQDGTRVEGADKLLWAKASDYRVESVTVSTCWEVHAKLLDKNGVNVRVTPDGQPIADGSQTGWTYRLVPGNERGTWLVSSAQATTTC